VARRRVDPVSLVLGVTTVAAGLIVLAGGRLIDDAPALVPVALIALGGALLLRLVRGPEAPPAPEPPAPPWPPSAGEDGPRDEVGPEGGEDGQVQQAGGGHDG
jgi:hypothetical protein